MDFEPQLIKKQEKIPVPKNPGIFWFLIILMLALLGLAVSIFGNLQNQSAIQPTPSYEPSPTESKQPRIYTVSYKSGVFSPTNLRIHAGDTVKFKNDGIFPIRILSGDIVGFDSVGNVPQSSFFSFTFAAKGIFGYHNEKNANEAGTIIVR